MVESKLQAVVYDILRLEEGAGKRGSECGYRTLSIRRPLPEVSSLS